MSRRKLPVIIERACGTVRAESTQRAQDFERTLRRDKQLSCRPGCVNCCYLPIEISLLEAITIYRELTQRGRWTPAFVKALNDHANQTLFLSPAVWMLTRIACPLLKEGKCSIYDVRPFHCRTTWATGDPFYCDGRNFGPQTTLVPKSDVVQSFMEYEADVSKQSGVAHFLFPISRALLLAEKVVSGQLDAANLAIEVAKDL